MDRDTCLRFRGAHDVAGRLSPNQAPKLVPVPAGLRDSDQVDGRTNKKWCPINRKGDTDVYPNSQAVQIRWKNCAVSIFVHGALFSFR